MGGVVTFRSSYRLCHRLPDGERAPFLQVVEKSGNSRVLRRALYIGARGSAGGEKVELEYLGCKVTVRGRNPMELFVDMVLQL